MDNPFLLFGVCYPSFCMRLMLLNFFTTFVIFITRSFGWLGCSLGSLVIDEMDDDMLDILMVFCLVYLIIIEITLHLIM
jgi:hypothetical protein